MLKLSDAWWPLALATMAGLSTSLGAIVAVVRKPSSGAMAALLGIALGVMATVSCIELVARNAMSGEGDPFLILAAAISGALTYYILEPMFPKMDDQHDHLKKQDDIDDHEAFFQLLVQQQQQQPLQQHSSCDTERPGHGVSQRKVVTTSAGCYSAAGAVASGGGIGGAAAVMMTTSTSTAAAAAAAGGIMVAGGTGCSLTRKSSSSNEAQLSGTGSVTMVGVGGGAGRENSSLIGPGQLAGGGGSGNSTTGSSGEGVLAFGPGVMLPGGGGGGGSGATCDVGLLSPPGSAGMGGGLAAAAAALGRRDPRAGRMLRLGLLMAVTMTLHNLPEGFAVAFSAFTDFGPIMALAIALHNIPEGVIVAAPIFAATGSRWRAVGIATASGLSEPFGALLSLLLLQPFFTQERLHYLLAFVGGVMLAVCGIELWPEGRNCRHDRHFAGGIITGSAIMAWTLSVEG